MKDYNLSESIEYFQKRLDELIEYDFVEKRVGIGLMQGLRIKSGDILSKIIQECFKQRVLVLKAGRNTLRFLPPLTITKEEMDKGIDRVKKALSSL